MTPTAIALFLLAVAPTLVDGWLSRHGPKFLRGLAWVPFGTPRVVTIHESHLTAAATRSARPTHVRSASALAENGIIPFPAEEKDDDLRLVPVEGTTTAKILPSSTWLNAQPSARIDASMGPSRELLVLRAHITPLAFCPALAVVVALVGDRGAGLLVAEVVLVILGLRSLLSTNQAIAWAFDAAEARWSAPVGGWAREVPATRVEREASQPGERIDEASRPELAEASKRVLLDEEDGKETVVVMKPVEREPLVPRMRAKKAAERSRAT